MLGPVEVSRDGQVIELRGRLRLLLAVLVLADNAPVAMDYLIDLIWPEGAPASARNAVQVMVSHLRRRLRRSGDDEPIVSMGGGSGYLLRCKPEETDLGQFHRRWRSRGRAMTKVL
jgi:DNA-binding SARP family transcriptional activator